MAKITNYTTLIGEVITEMGRSDIDVTTGELLVQLAQERITRDAQNAGGVVGQETVSTGNMVGGTNTIALPASFHQVRSFTLTGAQYGGSPLAPVSPDLIDQMGESTSLPKFYAIYGTTILLGPTPDQAYPYRLRYTTEPALLDSSTQTNWFITNAPDVLFYATCLQAASRFRDDPSIQKYLQAYGNAIDTLMSAQQKTRIGHQPPRLMTGWQRSRFDFYRGY